MELFYAYIDPGSGSLVVQALIAGLVAIPVLFRRQIARVVRTLRRSEEPPSRDISDPDDTSAGT